jgi:manganese efflux pump family protein
MSVYKNRYFKSELFLCSDTKTKVLEMSILSVIFLAIGLAMDAFAVSITGGIVADKVNFFYAFKIALFFAIFQMGMPWLGWLLGRGVSQYIAKYDHWVAFILLLIVGSRMIYGSFQDGEKCNPLDFNKISVLIFLAIATSIDAFIAGVSLSLLEINIISVIVVIGGVTFFLALIGVRIGKVLGCLVEKYAELTGGIILIIIGIQVLVQHIYL